MARGCWDAACLPLLLTPAARKEATVPSIKCMTSWRETLAQQRRVICERSWAVQYAAAHFRHFCWAATTS
jgi:hypothetical protein